MWKGIDVSDNQGRVDWAKAGAGGVSFAILRSTRRLGQEDGQFAANLAGCRAQNIPVAVYKYTYAVTPEEARREALGVVALLGRHRMKDTMVWWDVEDRERLKPLGSVKLTACIREARQVIEAAGYRFGLYVGLYVLQEEWFYLDSFAAVQLWVARYYQGGKEMSFGEEPDLSRRPQVGKPLWGWQYTASGRVPGIAGKVDLNVCWQDPADWSRPDSDGAIWCVSIADVWSHAIAKSAAAAHPGCRVHRAVVLDAGNIEIWVASLADVWTQAQAQTALRQLQAAGITGVVHRIRVLE
ncbi:MAG: GH25 family lysozyme [Eubacteriales bacterium]|nr:GH25 family lysozyme [Eubacteriales bacterium]